MSLALSDYLSLVRLYIYDTNRVYWHDSDLTTFINSARSRIVSDTGCNRSLQTVVTTIGQEQYALGSFPVPGTIDVLNITNTTSRSSLSALSWTQLNREIRQQVMGNASPRAFAMFGTAAIFVSPPPDQTYSLECDTVTTPTPMVNSTDSETLVYPFTDAVGFYAAHLAKLQVNAFQESQAFFGMYQDIAKMSSGIPAEMSASTLRTQAAPPPVGGIPIGGAR